MKKIWIASVVVLVLVLAGMVIWLRYKKPAPPPPLVPVTLELKWLHQAQFAGNYVATEKGFYTDAGLDVSIIPFSFENPVIDAVASGKATFGITGADELMIARAKGIPIKAFAVIYKINPVVAYSLKKSGITKPEDFVGKTIGIERAADGTEVNVGILYAAMMSKLGIDRKKIREVTIGYDATELLAGETDVSTGYIINEPNQVIEAGQEVSTILMANYGVNMYADVLFAREDTIKNNSQLVLKFLDATLNGWRYAIEHEDEAVDITLKYAKDRTKQHESYMLKSSIPLIHTVDFPIGWMDKKGWDRVKSILTEQKLLSVPVSVEDAYTDEFLRTIYKK